MVNNVSWFSTNSDDEDKTTNHCLSTLKLIYKANLESFSKAFSKLFGRSLSSKFIQQLDQQEQKYNLINDECTAQNLIQIHIETKRFDWLYSEQLEERLQELVNKGPGLKFLLVLGNFKGDYLDRFSAVIEACDRDFRKQIIFQVATFEEFLSAITAPNFPVGIDDAIHELRLYLDQSALLPSWDKWLDVINCSKLPKEVLDGAAYMCPAKGGAYSHSRCKFFGMFRKKKVEKIALIRAVVDVEAEDVTKLLWNNSGENKDELLNEALNKVSSFRPNAFPTRVFLLGELFETEFIKDTPSGFRESKAYFNIESSKANNAEELAQFLNSKHWEEIFQNKIS